MKFRFLCVLMVLFCLFSACLSTKTITSKERKTLHQKITESPVFSQSYTGFQLYDPVHQEVVYEQLADKYFTPASNTKIFTYYAAAKVLGDKIPALKYSTKGDSLIFWGTGDPTLLHPRFSDNTQVIHFLNGRKESLFYCPDNFMQARYGAGWMWDDFSYYFQVELGALPIYGNFIHITGQQESYSFQITPSYFTQKVKGDRNLGGSTARFFRKENENTIQYNEQPVGKKNIDRELPFIYSDSLAIQLLQDSVEATIELIENLGVAPKNSQTIYSVSTDSVLQKMMQASDNFLAEQLILLVSNTVFDTINTRKGISWIKENLLSDAPDELLWTDGSGLTRYNQFTPRSMVYVLHKIYEEMPPEKWQSIFPAGGKSGTIATHFGGLAQPYVYAKTGSMRGVRCLSGFLLTKSGKTLIFSFMNNHIPSSYQPWTVEMEAVLKWLHETL